VQTITRRLAIGIAAVTTAATLHATPARADGPQVATVQGDQLVASATELITNLDAIGWPAESAYNFYSATGALTTLTFGVNGQPTTYRNETRCATFVRRMLTRQFSWANTAWFEAGFEDDFPNSAEFYTGFADDRAGVEDIENIRGFELRVAPYFNLRAGDIMAISYLGASGSESGHTAIVGAGSHLVDDTHASHREWAIRIIDSTSEPHGVPAASHPYPDTRFYSDANGDWTEASGAGMGWMFIRTSRATGAIIAHRWSHNDSTWHSVATRPINFGRVDLAA
jgi:hypothetical protein